MSNRKNEVPCEMCGRAFLTDADIDAALDMLANFNPGADEFTNALAVLCDFASTTSSKNKLDVEALDEAIEYFEKRQDYCSEAGRNEEMRLCVGLGELRASLPAISIPSDEDSAKSVSWWVRRLKEQEAITDRLAAQLHAFTTRPISFDELTGE